MSKQREQLKARLKAVGIQPQDDALKVVDGQTRTKTAWLNGIKQLRVAGITTTTPKQAKARLARREEQSKTDPLTVPIKERLEAKTHALPLNRYPYTPDSPMGLDLSSLAEYWGKRQYPRKRRWINPRGQKGIGVPRVVFIPDHSVANAYSSRYGVPDNARTEVPAQITIINPTHAYVTIWQAGKYDLVRGGGKLKKEIWKAPRGYAFGADKLGGYLIKKSSGTEAHLSIVGVGLAKRDIKGKEEDDKYTRKMQRINKLEAREQAKQAKIILEWAKKSKAPINYEHARKAGNCPSGTKTWALQRGINGPSVPVCKIVKWAAEDERVLKTIVQCYQSQAMLSH